MSTKQSIAAALAVLLLATGGWLTYAWLAGQPKVASGQPQKMWLYCPKCGLEMSAAPGDDKKVIPCPHCAGKGQVMEVRNFSKREGVSAPPNPAVPGVVFGVTLVMALAWGYFGWLRNLGGKGETAYLRLNCPGCDRRLRYRADQVGQLGKCPRCKRPIFFPSQRPVAAR